MKLKFMQCDWFKQETFFSLSLSVSFDIKASDTNTMILKSKLNIGRILWRFIIDKIMVFFLNKNY
jgi:hypothetical protein